MEEDFRKLYELKQVLSSPQFKAFASEAEKKINELSALLSNDDSVLNDKGKLISKEREMWRVILRTFGVKYTDSSLVHLVSELEELSTR